MSNQSSKGTSADLSKAAIEVADLYLDWQLSKNDRGFVVFCGQSVNQIENELNKAAMEYEILDNGGRHEKIGKKKA